MSRGTFSGVFSTGGALYVHGQPDQHFANLRGAIRSVPVESSDHEKAVLIANNEQVQRASAYQEQLTSLREDNSRAALNQALKPGTFTITV